MGRVTEHFGSEKCMVELEFTVDQVKELNKKAKRLGFKDHKELIFKAIDGYLEYRDYFQELRDSRTDE